MAQWQRWSMSECGPSPERLRREWPCGGRGRSEGPVRAALVFVKSGFWFFTSLFGGHTGWGSGQTPGSALRKHARRCLGEQKGKHPPCCTSPKLLEFNQPQALGRRQSLQARLGLGCPEPHSGSSVCSTRL